MTTRGGPDAGRRPHPGGAGGARPGAGAARGTLDRRQAAVVIQPDREGFGSADFGMSDAIAARGYEAAFIVARLVR